MIRRFQVGAPSSGTRLDLFLVSACSDLSRSRIQKLIEEGAVRLSGTPAKRSHVVRAGDEVEVEVPEPRASTLEPEAIPLSVLYEDEHLLAIDKPAGLVVHPAPGHGSGTLVNALLHHVRDLQGVGGELRPGIVHRLDRAHVGRSARRQEGPRPRLPLPPDEEARDAEGIPGPRRRNPARAQGRGVLRDRPRSPRPQTHEGLPRPASSPRQEHARHARSTRSNATGSRWA